MGYNQNILKQICLLFLFQISAYADPSCFDLVNQLKKEKHFINLNGGMWGYFEKVPELKFQSVDAIQLDSRINKIFFALEYLCETKNGIPLNDLATYISNNIKEKGVVKFKSELFLIGKTPEEIDIWLQFYDFSINNELRVLNFSKIRAAVNQATPLIKSYIELAENISSGYPSNEIFRKTKNLNKDIIGLLSQQPYLAQALDEMSHFPYWDINESTGGS